jgi:hypothetical protein
MDLEEYIREILEEQVIFIFKEMGQSLVNSISILFKLELMSLIELPSNGVIINGRILTAGICNEEMQRYRLLIMILFCEKC